ncbi:actin cortical patch SUR7/pH-response regulator pali [Xylariaceae sp. FL0255]|nr:actin cortical patch SUR7/pH-response regulator pali [Xylariaceae sp. FL0255]
MKPGTPGLVVCPSILLSLVAFVLALIALLAGTGPQQKALEPYHIIAVNLSGFGQDLIPTATTTSSSSQATPTSFFQEIGQDLGNLGSDIGNDISGELDNITNSITGEIFKDLGISEWYSLHIMAACEGNFAPNTSSPHASYNTTNCTVEATGLSLNLTQLLDHEISIGPLKLNTDDIPIPDKVQQAVTDVNDALLALFVFYVLSISFSGLAFLVGLIAVAMSKNNKFKFILWANVVISSIAVLTLLLGSAISTAVSNKGVQEINKAGKDVGISGIKGTKFITISWIAFGLMFITLILSVAGILSVRRNGGKGESWHTRHRHRSSKA